MLWQATNHCQFSTMILNNENEKSVEGKMMKIHSKELCVP